MPLCQLHHNMIHSKGAVFMANKFWRVKEFLEKNNWYLDGDKYRHAREDYEQECVKDERQEEGGA